MTDDNDKPELPPIQLLIAACPATDQPDYRYVWLHGFCLVTIRPGNGTVDVQGEVRIGHRHSENAELVGYLAEALEPGAVLAGYDLDDSISRLGRLPIDAERPAPANALLIKLRAMVEANPPLDVGCNDEAKMIVHNQSVAHDLALSENFEVTDNVRTVGGVEIRSGHDNGNPRRLAMELADTASACLLAIGECYLPDEIKPQLLAAWEDWRRNQTLVFPPVRSRLAANMDAPN